MKNTYPINETFKSKQKTTSGKVIPFEEIDLGLYKPNANCACFITSNSRIHAWITAIAEVIYIKEGKGNKNVVWTDKTDSNNKIVQTEFVISDSNTLESKVVDPDDFLYKVIIYLTTGKILTQGKLWESFCNHQFEKCKLLVNSLLNSDTEQYSHKTEQFKSSTSIAGHTCSVTSEAQSGDLIQVKTEETTPKCINNDIENSNLQTQDEIFVNTTKSITSADVQKQFDISNESVKVNSQRLEKEPEKVHESEKITEQTLTVIQNRIDIIEESLVKVSKSLANLLTLQSDSKTNILSELQNMSKSIKCTPIPPDTKIYESQLKEKNSTIEKLKKDNELLRSNKEKDLNTVKKDLEKKNLELQNQFAQIRKSKTESDMDNEKLVFLIDNAKKDAEEVRYNAKERIEEKDAVIKDLQDRIQSFLYDCEGNPIQPWIKKQNARQNQQSETTRNAVNQQNNTNVSNIPSRESTQNLISPTEKVAQPHSNSHMANKKTNDIIIEPINTDVIFMHDSICRFVDIDRLLLRSGKEGMRFTTYTIGDALGQVDMVSCAETIIIHVGINNLKNESAEEAFCKYTDLIQKALEKSELVVISLVLPSQIERLNVKIREFNERILYKYDTADKIKVCRNSNFISNGNVVKKFYWDSFRLNKFEGVRVLAGNIRNTLFPRTRNQVPHSQNNLYVNSYRESQKDTISSRNDYKYPYNTPNRKSSNRSDQGRNSEAPAGNTYQGPPNTYYDRKLADSIASAVASVFHQYHEFGS
ncbi:unnamed protein product [Mytilus edulis]|uniref:Uncharacterized protein n=1 Tax=Mytilus edulis TaxID=6550 RepID=A0A8S3RFN8_MYTED|nr:unnamed protein product [Mytilus edulis]